MPPMMPSAKRDQREKCDQHGADIERQMQAIDRAAGDGAEKIFFFLPGFFFGHHDAAGGYRLFGFGHEHF